MPLIGYPRGALILIMSLRLFQILYIEFWFCMLDFDKARIMGTDFSAAARSVEFIGNLTFAFTL